MMLAPRSAASAIRSNALLTLCCLSSVQFICTTATLTKRVSVIDEPSVKVAFPRLDRTSADVTLTDMSAKRPSGLFITGTDTNVGKTYVAMIIARRMFEDGIRVGVYKPVLSGYSHDHLHHAASIPPDCQDDDFVLWRAAGSRGELTKVCPQRFRAPIAPHLAARIEGRAVDRSQ